tara:strand:- start:3482 stop:3706 length:225 start_codon:yes stop_codon:yes gene_type:complete
MAKDTKLGRVTKITNLSKKWNESKTYVRIWTEDENGKNELPLLLTEREYTNALKRTESNKEDWGLRGWLQKLID